MQQRHRRVVAETLGHLGNAVPEVQQIRGDQVADLMRPSGRTPAANRELIEPFVTLSAAAAARAGR